MSYQDYKYKCLSCKTTTIIPYEWFKNDLSQKNYTCSNCGVTKGLKVERIRERDYNNFILATEIVGTTKNNYTFYLKVTGPIEKNFFEISQSTKEITVGRSQNLTYINNDETTAILSIPDQYVSRKHCTIEVNILMGKTSLSIKDNNSLNGTYLNHDKLDNNDQIFLKPNDVLKIGETTIEICI